MGSLFSTGCGTQGPRTSEQLSRTQQGPACASCRLSPPSQGASSRSRPHALAVRVRAQADWAVTPPGHSLLCGQQLPPPPGVRAVREGRGSRCIPPPQPPALSLEPRCFEKVSVKQREYLLHSVRGGGLAAGGRAKPATAFLTPAASPAAGAQNRLPYLSNGSSPTRQGAAGTSEITAHKGPRRPGTQLRRGPESRLCAPRRRGVLSPGLEPGQQGSSLRPARGAGLADPARVRGPRRLPWWPAAGLGLGRQECHPSPRPGADPRL